MKLHLFERSGNAYKLRLLLSMLNLPYDKVLLDPAKGELKSAAFLKLNPRGQVPVLEDGGEVFWESTGAMVYLARKFGGETWLPSDAAGLAQVMQWMAFAQNEVLFGLQWARAVVLKLRGGDVEEYRGYGRAGLAILEQHLAKNAWLALNRTTIADIANYPYVSLAPEGGIALEPYPAVLAWVSRVQALPGWIKRV
ncbi:MAG: glutathione S-transferase family protein [Betaproteobacteria bacterium]|nr:glutathione S-transferase family protein [Betaproteobacteria bacterium]